MIEVVVSKFYCGIVFVPSSLRLYGLYSNHNLTFSGMFKKILVVFFMGFMAWAYQAIQPPPPKICGSADGPPVTAPRIKLSDGRHLAYKEHGVPKDKAKYKIVYVHGFDSCRHDAVTATRLSPVMILHLFSFCYFSFCWGL